MTLPVCPSFRLDGKRALVTGAGAEVTLAARTVGEIEAGTETIRAGGGRARSLVLDVGYVAESAARIAEAGPFDVLVNNAGTNRPKPALEVSEEDFDAVLDLNLRSAYFVAQAVARGMVAAGVKGSLIHMSSQMGHVGGPNRTLYCASKWGLEGLSKALALDLAPHGIRSNTIAPTFIGTPMPGATSRTRRSSTACWRRSSSGGSARRPTSWARWCFSPARPRR